MRLQQLATVARMLTSRRRKGSTKLELGIIGALAFAAGAMAADLRIGIIGCDTSHAVAFTQVMNDPKAQGHVEGVKVVALFKGGSPDIQSSWSRIEPNAKKLQEDFGVRVYDSIAALCQDVDCVLLESVDGRPHLEQIRPVLAARKPVFVDKPAAGSLRDTIEIFKLAKAAKVPIFSSSSLRFASNNLALRNGLIGKVTYCETYGPCEIEPHHPDLFWYGIHGVEALYTVLGKGCQTVTRGTDARGKIEVVGLWKGGRKGVFREDANFHGKAIGEKGEAPAGSWDGYVPLVREIVQFFKTGVAPVQPEETIEIMAFMEAADESKRLGGAPVKIKDVIKRARK